MLETFEEISIGGLTKEQLLNQLAEKRVQFNRYAEVLFEHPAFVPTAKSERVKLVKVGLPDLCLSNPCSLQAIIDKAASLGLRYCPLFLAAFLRLRYLAQPEGPHLTVASLKPENDENYPCGFYLRVFNNAIWLRGYRTSGEAGWPTGNEFVFIK